MAYIPQKSGDKQLALLEEVKACSQQIDELIVNLALSGTTNQAEMSETIKKIWRLNRRIFPAANKAEMIGRQESPRVRAALLREARKRSEPVEEEE